MPSDIRSFFGGGGGSQGSAKSSAPVKKQDAAPVKPAKKARGRKVVSDDEEDEPEVIPKKPVTPRAKKVAKEPKVEETTSFEYFAGNSKNKLSKSTPIRSRTAATEKVKTTPTKQINGSAPHSTRRSSRKTISKSYAESDEEIKKPATLHKDDEEGDDDIFAEDFKTGTRSGRDDYEESSDEEMDIKPQIQAKANNKTSTKPTVYESDDDIPMAEIPAYDGGASSRSKRSSSSKVAGRKRKSKSLSDDDDQFLDDEDNEAPKKKSRKTAPKSTPKKPRAKKEPTPEGDEMQRILENVPIIRPPSPPPRDANKKFVFGGGNQTAAPPAAGTKEIPQGADGCLTGITFVFTGVLDSLGREEGQSLVKRYGGKVTGAPSKKTDFVVLGKEAGPKKLETIRNFGLKTIDEDGLFHLIRTAPANGGDGKGAAKIAEKKAKDEEKTKQEAAEMDKREKEKEKEAAKAAKIAAARTGDKVPADPPKPKVDDRLWVDKYAPDSLSSVMGNKKVVEDLQKWLRGWHTSARTGFKKGGADGRGVFRAAMLHGPPGVGKTTAAHLVAKLEGYDTVESNASDTRSKKLVEQGLRGVLDTTSLFGYFAGDGKKVESKKKKLVLVMDEVDGMSAGDRGGVGALAAVAKKTNIPMILICNERRLPKMKPFDFVTADFKFIRPTTDMIRPRIATICFREGIKLPAPVIDALIEGSNADIRQIINMISTIKVDNKVDNKTIDFNDSKNMAKAWEKHVILKPWDIVAKILRPQMFSPSSTATLNDKIELYFNDHEFSFLMLQENYLKTGFAGASGIQDKVQRNLKLLELSSKAADSISDGDLVDRMIHGSQQQWSLMPTHAVFSFVRPASYVYGNFNAQVGFASWLGQNSKQNKLVKFVKEIQGHMRLRSSADRHEVRQQYLPALWNKTVGVLQRDGRDGVDDVIDFMDSYYLTKEDFDAVQELGVGPMDSEHLKLETSTKATFTRKYNIQSHPMPFVKASSVGGVGKFGGGASSRAKPDLEEAVEESEDEAALLEAAEQGDEEDDELDLKKDKYIKAPKKKTAAKSDAASKPKGKGKRKKGDDEEDENEDASGSDAPPSKRGGAGVSRGRGDGRGRGRGRGK